MRSIARWISTVAVALLALAAASCASLTPPGSLPLGTPIDEARHLFGGPNGEYRLADGETRLEFRQHRQTYMLDFDTNGKLVATRQVLTPAVFATMKPGMSTGEVLARIGHPIGVFPVGWQQLQVWNYRFGPPEGDCVLFQVSFSNASGLVSDVGQGMDPACDAPSKTR